jgi:NitT/TauT family transport system permease protein
MIKLKQLLRNKTAQSWLWLVALLGLWELASRLNLVNAFLLPPFSNVIVNMYSQLLTGELGVQALNSLLMIIYGTVIALVLAVLMTLLSSWIKPIESLFSMLSTVFNPLPAIALMPLIIMWFGIGNSAMLAMIVHGVLWALVRHLLDGIRAIPKVYYEWSDNIELSPLRKFTDVLLYAILPELLIGIRVGWGRAWRALLAAEMIFGMIGNIGGIGYYIYNARAFARIDNVMSGVLIIVFIGIIFESVLFSQWEKRTVKKWGMMRD